MNWWLLGLLLYLGGMSGLQAQQEAALDSLEQVAAQSADPMDRAHAKYLLARRYAYSDPQRGIRLLEEVLLLLPDDSLALRGDSYLLRGNLLGQMDSLEQAIYYQQQARALFEQASDSLRLMRANTNMATCHLLLENYEQALALLYPVRQYSERHQLTQRLGSVYTNMLVIAMRQQDYPSALAYAQSALKIFKAQGRANESGIAHYNIGLAYYELGQLDSAEAQLQQALAAHQSTDNLQNQITTYNVLASVARKKGDLAQAYAYIEQALTLSGTAYDQARLQDGLLERADIYLEWGRYEDSRAAYADILAKAQDNNDRSYDVFAAKRGLAQSYAALGQHQEAYAYLDEALALRDSLHQRDNIRRMQALERQYRVRFQTEQKERENELLAKDLKLEQLRATQNRYLAYGALFFLMVVLLSGYLVLRQVRLRAAQQEMMLKSKLLRNQMNPHFIFNALIAIQHFIYQNAPRKAAKYLSSFANLVRAILDHSREEYITLAREIQWLENYLQVQLLRFEHQFEYELVMDEGLDRESVLMPPMLIQPFIENALEHGLRDLERPGKVTICFTQKGNALAVTVEDDGRGLEAAAAATKRQHKSLALTITQERLSYLNARTRKKIAFDLHERPEGGTRVLFELPLKKRF